MLEGAAAAASEVGTGRLHPLGARLEELNDPAPLPLAGDERPFIGQKTRDELATAVRPHHQDLALRPHPQGARLASGR
jgi:hypothetical protein